MPTPRAVASSAAALVGELRAESFKLQLAGGQLGACLAHAFAGAGAYAVEPQLVVNLDSHARHLHLLYLYLHLQVGESRVVGKAQLRKIVLLYLQLVGELLQACFRLLEVETQQRLPGGYAVAAVDVYLEDARSHRRAHNLLEGRLYLARCGHGGCQRSCGDCAHVEVRRFHALSSEKEDQGEQGTRADGAPEGVAQVAAAPFAGELFFVDLAVHL